MPNESSIIDYQFTVAGDIGLWVAIELNDEQASQAHQDKIVLTSPNIRVKIFRSQPLLT
jgi:hypothetical protein